MKFHLRYRNLRILFLYDMFLVRQYNFQLNKNPSLALHFSLLRLKSLQYL